MRTRSSSPKERGAAAAAAAARPPPSAFRSNRNSSGKGKEREQVARQNRPGRHPWLIDHLEARRNADLWMQQDRVILILGGKSMVTLRRPWSLTCTEPTRATLEPLLYCPSFQDTLILIGTLRPVPEIEALSSPSQLMNSGDHRTIYPTIQPFSPTAEAVAEKNPIPAIIEEATFLAEQYRRYGGTFAAPTPSGNGRRSRRGSSSSGTTTPPVSGRHRFANMGRRNSSSADSIRSVSRTNSFTDLARIVSGGGRSRPSSRAGSIKDGVAGSERTGTIKRISSFFFFDESLRPQGPPIDAAIDFLPMPPLDCDSQTAMHTLLQHTIVLTSGLMPVLTKAGSASKSVDGSGAKFDLAPLSLVHIVPIDAPPTLAPVIERFLVPLLPTMSTRVRRHLFSCVTGLGAWLAPHTDADGTGMSGAETLLFGGARCVPLAGGHAGDKKMQAMMPGWDYCQPAPGALVDLSKRSGDVTPPTFDHRDSANQLSQIRSNHASASAPSSPTAGTTSRDLPILSPSLSRSEMQHSNSDFGRFARTAGSSTSSSTDQLRMMSRSESAKFTSRFDTRSGATSRSAQSDSGHGSTGHYMKKSPSMNSSNASSAPPRRAPSALRNSTQPTQQQGVSPPTPELDPSMTSSCSSSSVVEPSSAEERSVNSAENPNGMAPRTARKSASAPSIRSISRFGKGFSGFTSIFKRRGVAA